MSQPDDAERALIDQLKAGDRRAFALLLRSYQRRVFGLVRRLVGTVAEAEEIVQEAFLQALRAQDRFDTNRPFRPWIYKIAVNVCRNYRRAGARREIAGTIGDDEVGLFSAELPAPDRGVDVDETRRLVERLLRQLPAKQSEVLLLRFAHDLSYAELSEIYRLPETVLKMRVHRALAKLRGLAEGGLQ